MIFSIPIFLAILCYYILLPKEYKEVIQKTKQEVIDAAKLYIEQHGYVNLQWFVKKHLAMNVKNSFITSVAIAMTKDGKYLREKNDYKRDFTITSNPNPPRYPKLIWWLKYVIIPLLIGIALIFATIYLTKWVG